MDNKNKIVVIGGGLAGCDSVSNISEFYICLYLSAGVFRPSNEREEQTTNERLATTDDRRPPMAAPTLSPLATSRNLASRISVI